MKKLVISHLEYWDLRKKIKFSSAHSGTKIIESIEKLNNIYYPKKDQKFYVRVKANLIIEIKRKSWNGVSQKMISFSWAHSWSKSFQCPKNYKNYFVVSWKIFWTLWNLFALTQ